MPLINLDLHDYLDDSGLLITQSNSTEAVHGSIVNLQLWDLRSRAGKEAKTGLICTWAGEFKMAEDKFRTARILMIVASTAVALSCGTNVRFYGPPYSVAPADMTKVRIFGICTPTS